MSASVNSRRVIVRKAPPPFTAHTLDNNNAIDYIGTATKTVCANQHNDELDIEVKTLRFELSQ